MASDQPEPAKGLEDVVAPADGFEDLVLDRDAEVPIGVQLAWALRTRIRDGRFAPGQRLPGLRDLAEALHVNANTVRSVYQRLEQEGIVDSQQGSGTFVADAPRPPSAVGTIAAQAAQEALDTGVDPREVAAALYVVPQSSTPSTDAEAGRRRQLRTQIAALERTLVDLEVRHPVLMSKPGGRPALAGPRLLSVGELEQVQTQLVARLAALQAAIDGRGSEPEPPEDPDKRQTAAAPRRAGRAPTKTRPAPAGA